MDRKTRVLLFINTIFCIFILIYSSARLYTYDLPYLIYWVLLATLCESLPILLPQKRSVSVTFAILLACQLSYGTYFTTIVAALCNVFVVYKGSNGEYRHVFNLPIHVTLMNISNFTISIFMAGMICSYIYTYISAFPIALNIFLLILLVILYITVVFLINSITATLFTISRELPFFKTWIKSTYWAYPNFLAIAPIGYFIHLFYDMKYGALYILLLLGPLLLARYSFILYIKSKEQYYITIKALSAAIEAKDKYTEGHSRRVESYTELIAKKMGFKPSEIDQIKVAALLHDIGKIGIDDAILSKPSNLAKEEWDKVKQHPQIGIRILEDIPFPQEIKDAIIHHHERYDGDGYPDGLKGDEISIGACILGAVDAYDAMTSDRPYRKALSKEAAIENLIKGKGKQFHPRVVDVFISVLNEVDDINKCDNNKAEAPYVIG